MVREDLPAIWALAECLGLVLPVLRGLQVLRDRVDNKDLKGLAVHAEQEDSPGLVAVLDRKVLADQQVRGGA